MSKPKEKVAAILKYRGNRDKLIHWLSELPKKSHVRELTDVLEKVRDGKYILWTFEGGVRIL